MNTNKTAQPLKLHTRLAVLILVIGVVLMARQMYADDEPGAIPLLLVIVGVGWFFVTRVRAGRTSKTPHVESPG